MDDSINSFFARVRIRDAGLSLTLCLGPEDPVLAGIVEIGLNLDVSQSERPTYHAHLDRMSRFTDEIIRITENR